jgi:hypothetical protein
MTPNEFSTWLDMHQALFPGLVQWLALNEDRGLLLDEWQTVLRKVSLSSCKAASRAILDGRMEAPFYSELPKCVRAWAAELDLETRQQTPVTNNNPLLCELCDNSGLVSIWHPLVVRSVREDCATYRNPRTGRIVKVFEMREYKDDDGNVIEKEVCRIGTSAVACKCSLGDKYATTTKGKKGELVENPRYGDSVNHVAVRACSSLADIENTLPDNFVQEFADF